MILKDKNRMTQLLEGFDSGKYKFRGWIAGFVTQGGGPQGFDHELPFVARFQEKPGTSLVLIESIGGCAWIRMPDHSIHSSTADQEKAVKHFDRIQRIALNEA